MRIENQIPANINTTKNQFNDVQSLFNSTNILFIALKTYMNFNNLDRYAAKILSDLTEIKENFASIPIYEGDLSKSFNLSPKDKVIVSKTLKVIEEFNPHLKNYIKNYDYDLSPFLKKATLQISLIKAFSFYPTKTQSDLIYLGQFSAMFSQQFSSDTLNFELPNLEEAQNAPTAFAKQAEAFSTLAPTYDAITSHIPKDSPYKNQITILYHNLSSAVFNAKMLLNQLKYGQKDLIENSVKATHEAFKTFLEKIELPF